MRAPQRSVQARLWTATGAGQAHTPGMVFASRCFASAIELLQSITDPSICNLLCSRDLRCAQQVCKALDSRAGGSLYASLDEVVAKLSRAKVRRSCVPYSRTEIECYFTHRPCAFRVIKLLFLNSLPFACWLGNAQLHSCMRLVTRL